MLLLWYEFFSCRHQKRKQRRLLLQLHKFQLPYQPQLRFLLTHHWVMSHSPPSAGIRIMIKSRYDMKWVFAGILRIYCFVCHFSNSNSLFPTLKQTTWKRKNSLPFVLFLGLILWLSGQIYISLEGVDQEKIQTEFKPMSFDAKFHDVQGKNYRCAIPKLNKEIVPEKCKVVVKPTRVIITLFKASKGNWPDLHFKEDKVVA